MSGVTPLQQVYCMSSSFTTVTEVSAVNNSQAVPDPEIARMKKQIAAEEFVIVPIEDYANLAIAREIAEADELAD